MAYCGGYKRLNDDAPTPAQSYHGVRQVPHCGEEIFRVLVQAARASSGHGATPAPVSATWHGLGADVGRVREYDEAIMPGASTRNQCQSRACHEGRGEARGGCLCV